MSLTKDNNVEVGEYADGVESESAIPPAPTSALRPVDSDGVVVVSVGTGIWLVALIVLSLLHNRLERDGHLWWIAMAAVGFGLGLIGIAYCLRLRQRTLRRAQ